MEFSPYHLKTPNRASVSDHSTAEPSRRKGEQAWLSPAVQEVPRVCRSIHAHASSARTATETTPARAFPSRQQQEALLTRKGEGLGVVGDLMHRALRGLAPHQAVEVVANTAVAEPLDVDVGVAGGGGFAVEAKELSAP